MRHVVGIDLPVRHQGPGDIVALGAELGILPFPAVGIRGEPAAHVPGAGRVVNMVHIPAGAEHIPGIEDAAAVEIQVVFRDEFPQIRRAEVRLLPPEGVVQVEGIHGELIRRDNHRVVWDLPGHPVVAADGLQPPDLILVVEGDAV